MDPDAFRAINECSLVFDGRLVVDNHFATNDPLMYDPWVAPPLVLTVYAATPRAP
jgi:hypothetical protein